MPPATDCGSVYSSSFLLRRPRVDNNRITRTQKDQLSAGRIGLGYALYFLVPTTRVIITQTGLEGKTFIRAQSAPGLGQ